MGCPKLTYHRVSELKIVYAKKELTLKNSSEKACRDYPYGMSIGDLAVDRGADNKIKYNGKELQDDELGGVKLNLYDYNTRYYMPDVPVFTTNDLLAEKYSFQSTYAYAINNPIRFIDFLGLGPGDRIKLAQSMLGTSYKQETTKALRTGSNATALANMDCSEYVSRVLAGDGITDGVQHNTSGQLVNMFSDKENFVQSTTPQAGDLVAWDGHTGVVESFNDETQKVTVLHETKYTKQDGTKVESAVREEYSTSYYEGKGAGFYHPKEETQDVIGKTFSGGEINQVTVETGGTSSMQPLQPIQPQTIQVNQVDIKL